MASINTAISMNRLRVSFFLSFSSADPLELKVFVA